MVTNADGTGTRPPARGVRAARVERELSALMGDWGFVGSDADGGAAATAPVKPDPDNPPPPIYISLLSDGEEDTDDDPAYTGVRWERYQRRQRA